MNFLAEFYLGPNQGFVCDDPFFKALDERFSGKLCVDVLVEEFSLPISKTLASEHVQGSNLALGILDPYWCLGGLIFAMASFIPCDPFLIAVLPYDPDEDASPHRSLVGEGWGDVRSGDVS